LERVWPKLDSIDNLYVFDKHLRNRLGVISFRIDDLHYNLAVKLLNDRYGIQVRGGCSCAGTYGHYLLEVSYENSRSITDKISLGDMTFKPGWIRMSFHPTMTDQEIDYIMHALKELSLNHKVWAKEYEYCSRTNEFRHVNELTTETDMVNYWFSNPLL